MQSNIVAGETLNYRATLADYPASAGWSVRLILNRRAGGSVQTVNSTADGDDHLVQAPAALTVTWSPGDYAWELWAIKSAEQYRVDAGQIRVQQGLISADAGLDTRSAAEKGLEAIDAVLLGKATSGVLSYQINGRELRSYELQDLLRLQAAYRRDVAAERAAARVAAGLGGRQRFVVRM